MEEWVKHFHLSSGKCFQMSFNGTVIRFRVKGQDSSGGRQAVNCDTGESFTFNVNELLKAQYATLREIDCSECHHQ